VAIRLALPLRPRSRWRRSLSLLCRAAAVSCALLPLCRGLATGTSKSQGLGSTCWCADALDGVVPLQKDRRAANRKEEQHLLDVFASYLQDRMVRTTRQFDPRTTGAHMYRCIFCEAREDPARAPVAFGALHGKQLFVDDYLIESTLGVDRFLEEAIEEEHEVLRRSETWESKSWGFPGSANHNGTHFVLHYTASRPLDGGMPHLAVATSADGANWQKQLLNTSFRLFGGADFCVLLDKHEAEPLHRYKMVYNCHSPKHFTCIATSPDGVAWRNYGRKFGRATDTLPCLYHERAGTYELVIRQNWATPLYWRGIRGTQVLQVDEDSFKKGLESKASNTVIRFELQSHWYFDRFGKLEWLRRQTYAHTRTLYEGVYLGLVHLYEWPLVAYLPIGLEEWQRLVNGTFMANHIEKFDTLNPYLATSRDGVHYNFQWIYGGQPLRLRQGLKHKFLQPASQIVTAGGFHWLFYTGSPATHHDRWDAEERLFLARFPLDRLSGLMPTTSGRNLPRGLVEGVVTTRAFAWPRDASMLLVNTEVPEGSSCRVLLLGADDVLDRWRQREVELAQLVGPQHGDSGREVAIDVKMRWQFSAGKATVGPPEQVHLQFRMQGPVRLYAFELLRSCDLPLAPCHDTVVSESEPMHGHASSIRSATLNSSRAGL